MKGPSCECQTDRRLRVNIKRKLLRGVRQQHCNVHKQTELTTFLKFLFPLHNLRLGCRQKFHWWPSRFLLHSIRFSYIARHHTLIFSLLAY